MNSQNAKQKILIVDDEPGVREGLAFVGEMADMEVVEAENGLLAFEYVLENHQSLDIILSDLAMPQMNGLEFLKRIREKRINTPFLFITGLPSEEFSIKSFNLGAFDSIEKPFKLQNVLKTIEACRSYRVRHELIVADLEGKKIAYKPEHVVLLAYSDFAENDVADHKSFEAQIELRWLELVEACEKIMEQMIHTEDPYFLLGAFLRRIRALSHCYKLQDCSRVDQLDEFLIKLATQLRVRNQINEKSCEMMQKGIKLLKKSFQCHEDSKTDLEVFEFLSQFAA